MNNQIKMFEHEAMVAITSDIKTMALEDPNFKDLEQYGIISNTDSARPGASDDIPF